MRQYSQTAKILFYLDNLCKTNVIAVNSKNAITAKHYYYKTKDLIVRGAQCIYMLGNCALLHDTIIKWLLYCSLFQTRYEKFLVCVKNNRSDALHILQPKAMTEWERERERVRNRVFFCLVWKHLCTFKLELEKILNSKTSMS